MENYLLRWILSVTVLIAGSPCRRIKIVGRAIVRSFRNVCFIAITIPIVLSSLRTCIDSPTETVIIRTSGVISSYGTGATGIWIHVSAGAPIVVVGAIS